MKNIILTLLSVSLLLGLFEFFGKFKKTERITGFLLGIVFLLLSFSVIKNYKADFKTVSPDGNINVSTAAAEKIAVKLIDTVLKENGVTAKKIEVRAYFEDGNIKIKNVSVTTEKDAQKTEDVLKNHIVAEKIEVKYDKGRT